MPDSLTGVCRCPANILPTRNIRLSSSFVKLAVAVVPHGIAVHKSCFRPFPQFRYFEMQPVSEFVIGYVSRRCLFVKLPFGYAVAVGIEKLQSSLYVNRFRLMSGLQCGKYLVEATGHGNLYHLPDLFDRENHKTCIIHLS